jgi:hypothetical protein
MLCTWIQLHHSMKERLCRRDMLLKQIVCDRDRDSDRDRDRDVLRIATIGSDVQ